MDSIRLLGFEIEIDWSFNRDFKRIEKILYFHVLRLSKLEINQVV